MFEIGWSELLLIGVVALLVIGPKDLPDMFRTLGRFTAKMRGMARDFQRAMDQAANETGVKDVAADLKAATSAKSMGLDAVKDAVGKFEKWDPLKNAARPTVPMPTPAATAPAATATPAPVRAPAPAPLGPATQALADQKAAKVAIMREAAEKMKAVDAPVMTAPIATPAKPARKPRAAKTADGAAPKPKRGKAKAGEA